MAFSCLTHIFTATASTLNTTNTGDIHRAPLPQDRSSTFLRASNMPSTAFAPTLVTGTTYRDHVASLNRLRDKTTEIEGETRDSWVPESESRDGDGWHVGYEQVTQIVVRRKGRGAFMFERAMMERWGVEDEEGDGDDEEEEKGRYGAGRLEDGFEYQGWVDEEMTIVSTEGVEGEVLGRAYVCQDEEEMKIESRNAMEGNRNSVGRALFWNKF